MTDDPFLDDLRGAWQRQPVAIDRLRREVARRNARQDFYQAAKLAAALVILAIAGAFLWRLVMHPTALDALAAAAFLAATPLALIGWRESRALARIDHAAAPAKLVEAERARAIVTRGLLWIDAAAAVILFICAIAVLGLAAAGLAEPDTAFLFAILWALSAAAALIAYRRRRSRLTEQISRYTDLIGEL